MSDTKRLCIRHAIKAAPVCSNEFHGQVGKLSKLDQRVGSRCWWMKVPRPGEITRRLAPLSGLWV
jgi:hypothetical protein